MEKIIKALSGRGFTPQYCQTVKEAEAFILENIALTDRVGVGGSTTVTQMGLRETLRGRGNQVFFHSEVGQEERLGLFQEIMGAQAYLCSVNALTTDGRLWMIDGTGNRVSAVCYGPQKVFFICGKNKIVEGGEEEARLRMKANSNPLNCKRLNLPTPCAKQGKCPYPIGVYGPHCICNFTMEIGKNPKDRTFYVLVIEEEIGY